MSKISQKNFKKLLILISLFMILVLIYGVIRIYALFHSELNSEVQLKNGTWNIIVNDVDISKGKDINFDINDISVEENSHVKPGKIAPGLTGSFKISIDPKETNVSIRYDVSLNEQELTNSNLVIKSVTETKMGNSLVKVDKNTYAGIISLEDIEKGNKNEITVEIEWLDNEEDTDQDIEIGEHENFSYKIPISIHVCQYLGEELNTYIEN